MTFAAAIAAGHAAVEAAWGVTFTIAGGPAMVGTFDRLARTDGPDDGGIKLTWDASIVARRAQFGVLLDEGGNPILDEGGEPLLAEGEAIPTIGQKLTTGGQVYRIGAIDLDAHQVTMRLINIHR